MENWHREMLLREPSLRVERGSIADILDATFSKRSFQL
jgi:hypothetical protein